MRGVRITLVIDPDEATWGFLDAIADGKASGESVVSAVRSLASEDVGSLFDEAQWQAEILTEAHVAPDEKIERMELALQQIATGRGTGCTETENAAIMRNIAEDALHERGQ